MLSDRQLFIRFLAQTSDSPLSLEISRAEGIYLYDTRGNAYVDLISGVSVSNIGHVHPRVTGAVRSQLNDYMHLMVYGEFIESPQVRLAKLLVECLPGSLDNVYFVSSGSEANEGAMKLAKRYTGRPEICYFRNAYHGSTHGALSITGNEVFRNSFRPLIPATRQLIFNEPGQLREITRKTAAVFIEPIQAEGGVVVPSIDYMKALRERCNETGALLVLDEIQTGFGRTGTLFAFQDFGIIPDVLTLAKSLGGGMPLGAFVASREIMSVFKTDPVLGHITTFGGNPVSCAAGFAALQYLLQENLIEDVNRKGEMFKKCIRHPGIREIRGKGLLLAVELNDSGQVRNFIRNGLKEGLVTDWFIFHERAFRIAPPLIISEQEIEKVCKTINHVLEISLRA